MENVEIIWYLFSAQERKPLVNILAVVERSVLLTDSSFAILHSAQNTLLVCITSIQLQFSFVVVPLEVKIEQNSVYK